MDLFENVGMLIIAIACVIFVYYKNRLMIKSDETLNCLIEDEKMNYSMDSQSYLSRLTNNDNYFQSIQASLLNRINPKTSFEPVVANTPTEWTNSSECLISNGSTQDSIDSEDLNKNPDKVSHSVSFQGFSRNSNTRSRSSSMTEDIRQKMGKNSVLPSNKNNKIGQVQFTVFFNAFSTILKMHFIKVINISDKLNLDTISIHGLVQDEVKKRRFKTKTCSLINGVINETATFQGITKAMLPNMIMRLRLYGDNKKNIIHVQKLCGEFVIQFNKLSPIDGTKVICKSFYITHY
ncbi:uncharacterized protein TRIADDRAFT_53350 [Trichoplax adhaerens]|uniref:Uncharacterized protein n=1 Tax=Trichoplax adhaerens TaxID=10228 RepID=B3RNZ8_TRIAD|nr:predicted protein [Trichoplax adhaerens]EDV28104.1 predicted protein [Trichoplax adhaerens]|eukprot:XP_002109938.1 predicted protein [Trichoplax adhaerens]